jgi:PadR family transcriptional regulator PadR
MLPKVLIAASVRPIMLSIVAYGETYGYQIVQRIHDLSEGKIQWSDGTLYPVLHKLETEGLVASRWKMSEVGRQRKYYRLTEKGRRELELEKRYWLDVHSILEKLWAPGSAPQFA